ncbi:MAG TPA: polyphosphate polymerase domain-containing protein [Planctomycetes bacterium]|nr:polyphosphate polymerase domain-containing protein [Planctomycetota bacterium]HIK59693.1 polyphosphate polymerase domain-containing protein [Planctomycetota bacterium]
MDFTDRTLSSRYELKYWLHPSQLRAIREAIGPFVQPDQFARLGHGNSYPISSLYLDTRAHDLYRTTVEGHKDRFKLRIRSYSDEPGTPVYLEIKRRANQVVRKVRARVSRAGAQALLRGGRMDMEDADEGVAEFISEMRRLDAGSVIRVRYEREAYESVGRDPVRITLDSEVMFKATHDGDLSLGGTGWSTTPTEGVILEVKFTDNCPHWIAAMVGQMNLENLSIPKYVLSLSRSIAAAGGAEHRHAQ